MAAENRFTNRDSKKENIEYNLPEMLVNIMQQEFPDDPIYKSGEVTPKKLTQTINGAIPTARTIDLEDRNGLNILTVESGSKRYAEYKLEKSYPTISEEDLEIIKLYLIMVS